MARKIADTKKMTHEEWVKLRESSIGGSEAAICVGMNQYSSLITLYAQKTGLVKPIEDNEAMRIGRDLEQYVADRYTEKTGKKVRNDMFMYAHDDYDFITANIDRRIVYDNAGLECKTMGSFNGYNLEGGEVPAHYYCQCQHYMAVMGWAYMDLAVLVLQKGLYVIHIERNEDFINRLIEAEVDFWKTNVEPRVMPVPDGSEASLETLKELYPTAEKDSEMEIVGLDQMIEDYKALGEMEKDYKQRKDAIKAQICAALGDHEIGIGERYGCSWKNQSKTTVDTDKLKANYPDVYARCTKTSEYRTFRTKSMKKKGA